MELSHDDANLAAAALLRIASEESDGPGQLTGRMRLLIAELVQRNGPGGAAELAIALARRHFALVDSVAHALNLPAEALLEASQEDTIERIRN